MYILTFFKKYFITSSRKIKYNFNAPKTKELRLNNNSFKLYVAFEEVASKELGRILPKIAFRHANVIEEKSFFKFPSIMCHRRLYILA